MKNALIWVAAALLSLTLTACGGGGSGSSPIGDSGPGNQLPAASRSLLTLIFPAAIAQELPDATEIHVSIDGQGEQNTKVMAVDGSEVTFDNLLVGDYTVTVEAILSGTEVGSAEQSVTVSESGTSTEIPLTINRADLAIEPVVGVDYSTLNGDYSGRVLANQCISNSFSQAFGSASTDTNITISGYDITVELSLFPDPTFQLTGTLDDSSGILTGTGTYQSSDFTDGDWDMTEVRSPEEGVLYFHLTLSGDCDGIISFVGVDP